MFILLRSGDMLIQKKKKKKKKKGIAYVNTKSRSLKKNFHFETYIDICL